MNLVEWVGVEGYEIQEVGVNQSYLESKTFSLHSIYILSRPFSSIYLFSI